MNEKNEDEIPRRADVQRNVEAERAIRAAMTEVECLGADERLTRAITLLDEARNAVGDYVDERGFGETQRRPEYFGPKADSYVRGYHCDVRAVWALSFMQGVVNNVAAKDAPSFVDPGEGGRRARDLLATAACDMAHSLEMNLRERGWLRPPCAFEEYATHYRLSQALQHLDDDDETYKNRLRAARAAGVVE